MDTYLELISNYLAKKKHGLHAFSWLVEIVLIRYVSWHDEMCQVQKCNSERNPLRGLLFFMKGEPDIWVDEDLCLTQTRHVSHEC